MPRVLPRSFFDRPTLTVARELLGKVLVRRIGRQTLSGIIVEVEAYDGPEDKACHAHRGKTTRNAVMFGPAGRWYVYFVYGMHWMLNIVTGPADYPAAVLIRGVGEPFDFAQGKWDGPGKLTKVLRINRALNGKQSNHRNGLWIEDHGVRVTESKIKKKPRIGVSYAKEWATKPYRFILEGYNGGV